MFYDSVSLHGAKQREEMCLPVYEELCAQQRPKVPDTLSLWAAKQIFSLCTGSKHGLMSRVCACVCFLALLIHLQAHTRVDAGVRMQAFKSQRWYFWTAAPSGRLQRVITILQQRAEAVVLARHTGGFALFFFSCLTTQLLVFMSVWRLKPIFSVDIQRLCFCFLKAKSILDFFFLFCCAFVFVRLFLCNAHNLTGEDVPKIYK